MAHIVSHVNGNLQENKKISEVNKYFNSALTKCKDIDSDEYRILHCFYHLLDFSKPYYQQAYFHSIPQLSELTGISERTLNRKVKSLVKKGYWIIAVSGSKKKTANTYRLTSLMTDKRKDLRIVKASKEDFSNSSRAKNAIQSRQNGSTESCQNGVPDHTVLDQTLETEREEQPALSNSGSSNAGSKSGPVASSSQSAITRPRTASGVGVCTAPKQSPAHRLLADWLTFKIGARFENSRAKIVQVASGLSDEQLHTSMTFLSKFDRIFDKSELKTNEQISERLQQIQNSGYDELEMLKERYAPKVIAFRREEPKVKEKTINDLNPEEKAKLMAQLHEFHAAFKMGA